MTKDSFNVWDQAIQVLKDIKVDHNLGILEQWAIDYAIRSIIRDKDVCQGLTRTERAIKETEDALSKEFVAFKEQTDAENDRYYEIENRR